MGQWPIHDVPVIEKRCCPKCKRWLMPWRFAKNQFVCKDCKHQYYLVAKEQIKE